LFRYICNINYSEAFIKNDVTDIECKNHVSLSAFPPLEMGLTI
jgi:hypothetical protein